MSEAPVLEHLYTATVDLGAPTDIGNTASGYRVIVPITGGQLEGPAIKGKVCPGGADWIVVRPDGVSDLDVRATVETDDGALIYVTIRGYLTNQAEILARFAQGDNVPVEDYYFGLAPNYETSDDRYSWLQHTVAVGRGEMLPGRVRYAAYAVR
jgi:hypothetical protein